MLSSHPLPVVLLLASVAIVRPVQSAVRQCSILVYGSTPAGLCAAIAASRQLQRAASSEGTICMLSSHEHVGGMVTGGLGATDTGGTRGEALIGGIAAEFFLEVGRLYGSAKPVYRFEPSIASRAFQNLLRGANVTVEMNELLVNVTMDKTSIASIATSNGNVFSSVVFIDATYEGDLMAMAGVKYTYGREGVAQYNESLAGQQLYSPLNQFYISVDPIDHATDTPLNFVSAADAASTPGEADKKVSAYNLRLCLTRNASNRVDITEPEGYAPEDWELVRRYALSPLIASKPGVSHFLGIGSLPNGKSDTNNAGPMSTDFIGASWTYPDANWTQRREIIRQHYLYTHRLLWFLGHDPALNETLRNEMLEYGLCADEYPANEWYEPHWPPQLYVREARRMVGPAVFTQRTAQDSESSKPLENAIGCGAYNFDSHNVQRYPCRPHSIACTGSSRGRVNPCCISKWGGAGGAEFAVIDEGDVEINPGPFQIPYDVLLPSASEATNLLVPGAVSASHVGFSCLRLEPQWMIMGHSSGTAAALLVTHNTTKHVDVQTLDRSMLHAALLKDKQILET